MTIDMLLLWSKDTRFGCVGLSFVQLTLCDEPISYIKLTYYGQIP